jgi:pimeloyl-ACP methyl ester carboxylesterase
MRVDIGGGTRLFFDVVGAGLEDRPEEMVARPTLLLLHGGPGSADHSSFRPWFDRFADSHQVVYLDHRGQGRSDERRHSEGWNLDTWADDIVRFCDALEITSPVVFGQSFGGMVAMHYAARHPAHPSRLVLSSTEARLHRVAMLDMFERLGGAPARDAAAESIDGEASLEVFDRYNELCLPLYNRAPQAAGIGPQRAWMNLRVVAHWSSGENRSFDLRDGLALIACPTLVLGGVDDPRCPVPAFEEIVELLTTAGVNVTANLFEDCGHGSYRDQPDQTEQILRSWLRA